MNGLVILGAIYTLIVFGFAYYMTLLVIAEWILAKEEIERQS